MTLYTLYAPNTNDHVYIINQPSQADAVISTLQIKNERIERVK